ncbi:MAG TPA: SDR family oxidoreductase [Candidatus Binataceae bacterium]|nr:SDR family oxidoreductase [Candidatus Binataceae bacterium]
MRSRSRPRLLVTGASGTIGRALHRELAGSYEIVGWAFSKAGGGLERVDLRDPRELALAFDRASPELVVHSAAVGSPDEAERDPGAARRINVEATAQIARLCQSRGARLIHFSTDIVFDGQRGWYREGDQANPINVYARTKLESERVLFDQCPGAVALRVALVFGWAQGGRPTFLDYLNDRLSHGLPVTAFTDQIRTPTPVSGIAEAVKRLLQRTDVSGVLHCTGPDRVSRLEFVQAFARVFGYPEKLVVAGAMAEVPSTAPRPRDCSLICDRMASLIDLQLPGIEESMKRLRNEPVR